MNLCIQPACRGPRRKPLALCVSALFAIVIPGLSAASTWKVNTCDEGNSGDIPSKTGTLRFAAEHAATTGDTIDMHLLSCADSKISLTTGSIGFAQDSLTIVGPGPTVLQIDASASYPGFPGDFRVFTHSGGGKLVVQDLGLSGGHVYHIDPAYASKGGCLYSKGSVDLTNVTVTACGAQSTGNLARGGGVYALGDLKLTHGTLTDNGASGKPSAYGGGAYTKGKLTLDYSTLSGNHVAGTSYSHGGGAFATGDLSASYSTVSGNQAVGTLVSARGGGLLVGGNVTVTKSTISGNSSDGNFGGLLSVNDNSYASNTFSLYSSTLSGNSAAKIVGGAYTNAGKIFIEHSTIAFNTAGAGKITDYFAPGMAIGAVSSDTTIEVESSIMSNNTYGTAENDFSVAINSITVGGSDNLVRNASGISFFSSTITACPLLAPLRDNGGLTETHALFSGSPALDVGNLADSGSTDQRGSAAINGMLDYLRVSGPIGDLDPRPDIGAYEMQQDEIVFNAGFDGCP